MLNPVKQESFIPAFLQNTQKSPGKTSLSVNNSLKIYNLYNYGPRNMLTTKTLSFSGCRKNSKKD